MDYIYHYESPLGRITLAGSKDVLTGLWFEKQKHFGNTLKRKHIQKELPVFEQTAKWLDIYFNGNAPNFTPPLYYRASLYTKAVWEILLSVPFGQTITYEDLSHQAAEKTGLRYMGDNIIQNMVACTPVSLIIPSHRAVRTTGSLNGYPGGTDKKIWLLKMEHADMRNLYIPKGLFYEIRNQHTKNNHLT